MKHWKVGKWEGGRQKEEEEEREREMQRERDREAEGAYRASTLAHVLAGRYIFISISREQKLN